MNIELFLGKLTYDHSVLLDDQFASAGWIHGMPRPERFFVPVGEPDMAPHDGDFVTPLPGEHHPDIAVRKEEWGGFVVHLPTMAVYQVDQAALSVVDRLKAGESAEYIRSNAGSLTPEEIERFFSMARTYQLLPTD